LGPGSGSTIFKGGSEDPDPDPQFSKGGSEDPDPDPLYQNVDPGIRIRIRIHVKIVWIRNPAWKHEKKIGGVIYSDIMVRNSLLVKDYYNKKLILNLVAMYEST